MDRERPSAPEREEAARSVLCTPIAPDPEPEPEAAASEPIPPAAPDPEAAASEPMPPAAAAPDAAATAAIVVVCALAAAAKPFVAATTFPALPAAALLLRGYLHDLRIKTDCIRGCCKQICG